MYGQVANFMSTQMILIHIPLNELRERLDELDKNQACIVRCHSGLRSETAEHPQTADFTVQTWRRLFNIQNG